MAKKRQSPDKRKAKISAFFKEQGTSSYQVKELKKLLSNKDEPTLRRDLDDLVKSGELNKSKDTSVYPNRAYYQWANATTDAEKPAAKSNAAKSAATPAKKTRKPAATKPKSAKPKPAKAAKPVKSKPVAATATKPASEPAIAKPKPVAPTGKREKARKLEAQIIALVQATPSTVSEITEGVGRQRPTIVKALERLMASGALSRTADKRPFKYFVPHGDYQAPVAAPAKASSQPQRSSDELPAMVQMTVNTMLDRLLAAERRVWELESRR